jgi:hypothetical protein
MTGPKPLKQLINTNLSNARGKLIASKLRSSSLMTIAHNCQLIVD